MAVRLIDYVLSVKVIFNNNNNNGKGKVIPLQS